MTKHLCYGCMEYTDEGQKCRCGFDNDRYEAQPHHLPPGTVLKERYMLGRVLGEGGFGITYVGRDLLLDMKVAVKEFYMSGYVNRNHTNSPVVRASVGMHAEVFEKNREKFLNEARALAKFIHEDGIVGIQNFFEDNNTAYMVMEFLEGSTLQGYLDRIGKISWQQTLETLKPVMASLERVHQQHIIHRDISPQNIMLLPGGRVKLLDFGAAREVAANDVKSLSVIWKPGYAPEEQLHKGEQGPWTDVYALCATMYRCITGILPQDAMERVFEDKLKAPKELEPSCSLAVSNVIMKGMSIYKDGRYRNVNLLAQDLERAAKDPENPNIAPQPVKKEEKRKKDDEENSDQTRYADSDSTNNGPVPDPGIKDDSTTQNRKPHNDTVRDDTKRDDIKQDDTKRDDTKKDRKKQKTGGTGNWNGKMSVKILFAVVAILVFVLVVWFFTSSSGKDAAETTESPTEMTDTTEAPTESTTETTAEPQTQKETETQPETEPPAETSAAAEDGDGEGTWTDNNGNTYRSFAASGVTDGYGICEYADGSVYDGEWEDGVYDGVGVFTWSAGEIYTGQWSGGVMEGTGLLVWPSGAKYMGEFAGGKMEGTGLMLSQEAELLYGRWENGSFAESFVEGEESWKDADGNLFTGVREADGDKPVGTATCVTTGGAVIGCIWEDGVRNGEGIYIWKNNDAYYGDWVNGERIGNGIYCWTETESYRFYTGGWKEGLMEGQGTMYFNNGDHYIGNFKEKLRDGEGVYYFASGNHFEGEWKDGERTYGTFYFASGGRYEGEFKDGERDGYGIYYYESGNRYEGEWKAGERTGQGTMYYTDGTEQTGVWLNNQFMGEE